MSVRVRRPDTARLELSRGDWLIVKKHLTAGETLEMFGLMRQRDSVDSIRFGLSRIIAHLVDWSIQDLDGKVIPITGKPIADVESALRLIDYDTFTEIEKAVDAHMAAMEQERKNERAAETGSSPISLSAA